MAKRPEVQGPLRLIVCGAAGRMGSQVAGIAAGDARFRLAGCLFHRSRGESFGAPRVAPEGLAAALAQADVLVDFSAPVASGRFAAAAAAAGKAAVIGTTGFSDAQLKELAKQARRAPLFLAPNFSRGVAVLDALAAQAARALSSYEAGVWELHHRAKKDAPSGTALRLERSILEARGQAARLPVVSQRLGDVIGEHTVTLAGPFERLELTHRAHSRSVFARGALDAALWLRGRKPGLYGMRHLVGLV